MCCNYCYYFKECKKAKKISSKCCEDCAEYEYCPFVLDEKIDEGYDIPYDGDSDMDIFGEGEEEF